MASRTAILTGGAVEGRLDLFVNDDDERKRIEDLVPKDWNAEISVVDSGLGIKFSCTLAEMRTRTISLMETLKKENLPKPLPPLELPASDAGSDVE